MPARKGLLAPQNTFLDTIATRFDGTRKYRLSFFFFFFQPSKVKKRHLKAFKRVTIDDNMKRKSSYKIIHVHE